jgi:hypothetical protein
VIPPRFGTWRSRLRVPCGKWGGPSLTRGPWCSEDNRHGVVDAGHAECENLPTRPQGLSRLLRGRTRAAIMRARRSRLGGAGRRPTAP